jgi:5-enolpyruvylshikimate-3-phosphate synthase
MQTILLTLGVCMHVRGEPVELCACGAIHPESLLDAARALQQLGHELEIGSLPGGHRLKLTRFESKIDGPLALEPSACPLKPMLLLVALAEARPTCFEDRSFSPDHIERVLQTLGLELRREARELRLTGSRRLRGKTLRIPPDISAALPLILAAAAREGTRLELPIAGMNPTRTAFLRCLIRAGADITRLRDWQFGNEPVAMLEVKGSTALDGFSVPPNAAPAMLWELLPLAAFASQCAGETRIAGLAPLRGGTPDRLTLAMQMLQDCGLTVELTGNVLAIDGPTSIHFSELNCADDLLLGQLGLTLALLSGQRVVLHGMGALERWWPEVRELVTADRCTQAV